jgi:hypothetical protein
MEAMSVLQTETLLISPSYRSIYLNDPGGWGGGEVEIPHPEPGRPYAPVMAWADPAVSPGSIYLGTASDTAKVWVTISVGEPSDIPAGAEFALSTEMEFAPLPPNDCLRLVALGGAVQEFRTIVVEPGLYTATVLVAGREQPRQAEDQGLHEPHEHFWIILNRKQQ